MAGQRGSGANAGLIARQAGMQGANIQQNAAGQAAALQAQQSLGALNQLGGIAGQQVGQEQAATGANTQFNLGHQSNLLNSIAGVNQANVQQQSNINNINAARNQQEQQMAGNLLGGLAGAAGSALTGPLSGMFGGGGSSGGVTASDGWSQGMQPASGGMPGEAMGAQGGQVSDIPKMAQGGQPQANYLHSYFGDQPAMAQGGKVPALVSPGEKYLNPQQVQAVAQGAKPMAEGKTVPGKPKVAGAKNSYANDTVKADLDEGGIVIPRSVTQSKDADKKAEAFVLAVLAKHGHKPQLKKKK